MAKKPKVDGPPSTKLARSKVIGGVATGIAGKKLKSEMKAVFLSAEDADSLRAQTREEMAQMVFAGLSKLRGTALKLAQVFCADTGLLPEEYLRTFEQSHYQVPGLSPPLVRSVLRRELKREPEEIFSEFGWMPAAAASLGQVHRAVLKDGTEVAVKVQYPGMQESLVSDMQMARMALKPLLRTGLIVSTLKQLEARLLEEIDYERELANMEWFRTQNYPFALHIPKGFKEYSSRRVLTMQWVDGIPIDGWARSRPAPQQVNAVAQSLMDLFVLSVFERRRFHSDANLGNFLITSKGELALLDFGAVSTLTEADCAFYRRLWYAQGAQEQLVRDYQERGAATDGLFWDECVQPYISWISQITSSRKFEFGANSGFVNEGFKLFTSQLLNSKMQNYSDELTLTHRTLLGLFTLFTKLKAEVTIPQTLS